MFLLFFYWLFWYFVGMAATAWALMLSVGSAHHNWWSTMPLMGYGDAFTIVFAGSLPFLIMALVWWAVASVLASGR